MMTSDVQRETAAEAHVGQRAFMTILALSVSIWLVNSTSILLEAEREGRSIFWAVPFFIEGTSVAVILALFPLVRWMEQRFPIGPADLPKALLAHGLSVMLYALIHVLAMGVIRESLYPLLFSGEYRFFDDPLLVYVYEARKDAVTYMLHLLTLTAFRAIEWHKLEVEAARTEARSTQRLTVKCGGRILRVEANGFVSAKAAGNYAELKLETGQHLARITLAELQKQLIEAGIDAVRVHRSWLVNRDAVEEIIPTGEGDVSIRLKTGETLPGSRRYRDRLEVA